MTRYVSTWKIGLPAIGIMLLLTSCASADLAPAAIDESPMTDLTVEAAENDNPIIYAASSIGSFATEFNANDKNRSNNIALASEAINNIVVQPGETFSYNETVGPTSRKNGYKLSTIFIKGKMFEGYGGGVCQVSSTLYNAAANAGMTIVERHDHTMPVPYVETGKDAATSYGGIDFKFKNEKSFPVKICSEVDNGNLSVNVSAV